MKVRGFTLIELLVVVVLVGLIGGLVAPSAQRLYERHRRHLELDRMSDFLAGAPSAAYLGGRELTLRAEGARLALQPDGPTLQLAGPWRLEVEGELRYWSNGATAGGTLHADHDGTVFRLQQQPGNGTVTIDEAG
ncbi:prepilin-type N-terminal cleavage/methylation domain-containing protein [Endothiovibrio diazotrophicus]